MYRNLQLSIPLAATLAAFASLAPAQSEQPLVVRPGAPGAPSKTVSPNEAADLSATRFSAVDVLFMQEMLAHHEQALQHRHDAIVLESQSRAAWNDRASSWRPVTPEPVTHEVRHRLGATSGQLLAGA